MNQALKDLELVRRQERKQQRILIKAQRDMQDFRDKTYWEDMFEGVVYGAIFVVVFLGLCCTLAYVFAKITL